MHLYWYLAVKKSPLCLSYSLNTVFDKVKYIFNNPSIEKKKIFFF